MKWTILIACGLWLGWPAPAAAHRLDEYLQATRIAFAQNSVDVEIDLTPGVGVAPQVVRLIDNDGDGALSIAEQRAYAALVVKLAALSIDGTPAPLVLAASDYPSVAAMRAGTGTIRLVARSTVRAQLTLEYVVDSPGGITARLVSGLGVGVVMVCALGWFRRSSIRSVVSRDGSPPQGGRANG